MRTPSTRTREHKKQETREALKASALELFTTQGFDRTTVNAIAKGAEVSRRTFFRYFGSKEDVILAYRGDFGAQLSALVIQRPQSEGPLSAIRNALVDMPEAAGADREQALVLAQLIRGTPALRARYLDQQESWARNLEEALATRATEPVEAGMVHHLTAAVALTTFEVALQTWTATNATMDLKELVLQAFAALGSGLDHPHGTARLRSIGLPHGQKAVEHSSTRPAE